jgi:hypothetical protein
MVDGCGVAVQAYVRVGGVEPTLRKKREGWLPQFLELKKKRERVDQPPTRL